MCYLYFFCLHCCLINTHIFDYPDSRLSGLFTEVPTSPDNRGLTVLAYLLRNATSVSLRYFGGLETHPASDSLAESSSSVDM